MANGTREGRVDLAGKISVFGGMEAEKQSLKIERNWTRQAHRDRRQTNEPIGLDQILRQLFRFQSPATSAGRFEN